MDRAYLKSKAKDQLRGRWGLAIITVLISNIFINANNFSQSFKFFSDNSPSFSLSFNLITLLLGGVISTGLSKFLLNFTTNLEEPNLKDIFSYFNIFFKTLGLYILIAIIAILGFILLIIPGIIVVLMYSQAFYILAEDPDKGIFQCLEESSSLMYGHKWELFVLELSFIGWWILAALTLGIGSLWVNPYQKVTETNFYLSLKYVI